MYGIQQAREICDFVKVANKTACLPQNDRTALHYAVAGKNKQAVQFLLQRRIKVDQKDKVGAFKKNKQISVSSERFINLNLMFFDSTVWLPYI